MQAEPTLTVISLGGGGQSSVIALMAGDGTVDREPPSVCEHLEWLKDRLSFPCTSWITVTASART